MTEILSGAYSPTLLNLTFSLHRQETKTPSTGIFVLLHKCFCKTLIQNRLIDLTELIITPIP